MNHEPARRGWLEVGLLATLAVLTALTVASSVAAAPRANLFTVTSLVADKGLPTPTDDPSLVNGWGLSAGLTTPWWASDNATNVSTLYDGTGAKQALTVAVAGGPTGTVFNGSATDFVVSQDGKSGAARFLFATEAGTILGWSPAVNGTTALVGAERSAQEASYKGLAILNDRLYASDFHNNRVDVFDASFDPVSLAGGFNDAKLPKGYAPFGIQALRGDIFVTYAKQDAEKKDDVPGGGFGYVDKYSPNGRLLAHIATGGRKNAPPNAPWGLALAPLSFGPFSGDVLVGNFGNGRISAYAMRPGGKWTFRGQLRGSDGKLIAIEGLWAIAFGNGAAAGPTTSLYFLAGPGGEGHGLFGAITAG